MRKSSDMDQNPLESREPIFVARQPIFTAQKDIWGYELLFRNCLTPNVAKCPSPELATQQVIADGYNLAQPGIKPGSRISINFPHNLLLDNTAFILPPETSVVEILETVVPNKTILERIKVLKANGYTIALDDFVGQEGVEPLLGLSDIIKVDLLQLNLQQIQSIVDRLHTLPCKLLAEKVEDLDTFETMKGMGFDLFQGFFFSKPLVIQGVKLSSSQISRIKLLAELGNEDFEMENLVQIIKADVALTYRLLRFINSTHFSLPNKIQSIHGGLALLGQYKARHWLRVTILADLNCSDSGRELVWLSVYRARFLERVAQEGLADLAPESMFILGLFSLLDVMLKQPMAEVLELIPLDERLKQYLLDPEGNGYTWFTFFQAQEHAWWEKSNAILDAMNMDSARIAAISSDAISWSSVMLGVL